MSFLDVERWLPVNAPIFNTADKRGRQALLELVAQFDVARALRYHAAAGDTFCNIFAWDVTRAASCEIPHWVDAEGRPCAPGKGKEQNVNATLGWLLEHGPAAGWSECDRVEAAFAAESGRPTVAVWLNPTGKHGHIAVCVPALAGTGLHIAQAGASNFVNGPLATGFGNLPVRFFTHP